MSEVAFLSNLVMRLAQKVDQFVHPRDNEVEPCDLNRLHAVFDAKIRSIEEAVKDNSDKNKSLAAEIEVTKGDIEILDEKVEASEGKIEILAAEIEVTKGDIEILDEKVEAIEGKIESIAAETKVNTANIESLDKQVKTNTRAIAAIESKLSRDVVMGNIIRRMPFWLDWLAQAILRSKRGKGDAKEIESLVNAWINLCISHILSELTFEKVAQATAAIELGADWLRTVEPGTKEANLCVWRSQDPDEKKEVAKGVYEQGKSPKGEKLNPLQKSPTSPYSPRSKFCKKHQQIYDIYNDKTKGLAQSDDPCRLCYTHRQLVAKILACDEAKRRNLLDADTKYWQIHDVETDNKSQENFREQFTQLEVEMPFITPN